MTILKRKDFAKWQAAERVADQALCVAVREMECGLIDADLGGDLYKKRIARPGAGKRDGYRTFLAARIGTNYVFLHGFAKSQIGNITLGERKALQFAGRVFLNFSEEHLALALHSGTLLEVRCDQQNH